ncbi:polyphosphate kinase 1 [Collinsella aerofaciens]|uniref:polyphosphate kinase 1 n=1 Tax=Collinsella aerofaciens TaxID=74426 RepID=UPI001E3DF0FE|nr:polyphosphate kinase 1 [Collinsella aerofaciens]MDB1866450.1 polyphosphate kinase 1 [Collinsella aerofaciens]MDB1869369.1 polyphosphate kinase 1 [Collinsella aerofaciens]MDB1873292.1 polyphosphate kinase 1 [Collinsella aerofaciens]
MPSKIEKKQAAAKLRKPPRDFSYTQNRELSWLRFDNRVLDEAFDESVPLFERLKFVSIFESNLDEFLMVRVGGLSDLAELKKQPVDNKSNMTASEQVDAVMAEMPGLLTRWESIFKNIEGKLDTLGVHRARIDSLTPEERTFVTRYFQAYVSPVISPLVIDPRHPFPNLRNGALYLACGLDGVTDEERLLGLIEIPASMNRVVEIPSPTGTYSYILLEDVILACLDSCFGSYKPLDRALIRVTRNADIDPDGEGVEEEEDYRQHMKRILKKRLRLQPVVLAVSGSLEKPTLKTIRKALELSRRSVFTCDIPLNLGYVFGIEGKIPEHLRNELLFTPFKPQPNPTIDMTRSIREQVLRHDKLLFYPYEAMNPFLDLVHEAAYDPECISLRITLYRVAKQSRLCESLIDAAENGKEVTVLMELRARFDEQNNIEWAERLEEAGCTVIYGSEGFKCHSKICQLTYREGMALTRLTLLGTGNFNEKTAKLYSDFMLMTAHPGIGEDANLFFRNLSLGNLRGDYRFLGVAPVGLKPLIMRGLDREIQRALVGEPARVFFKLNSLTDREVIDKIAEASCAGVRVDMIIRGISCLKPGVPGKTENVHVRSIVGRFLEHARVYAFGVDSDMIYLSSADMMTRNTEHRVEIAFPVLDPTCRALVHEYMGMQLRDNVKARSLTSDGTWVPVERAEGEKPFNSQEALLDRAYRNAEAAAQQRAQEKERVAEEAIQAEVEHGAVAKPEAVAAPPANEPGAAAEPAVEKAPKVQKVQATVIEPEPAPAPQPEPQVTKPAPETSARRDRPAGKTKAIERHRPGRVRMGLGLIGLGLKTLITGKTK